MKVLVTSARMPFALAIIRRLATRATRCTPRTPTPRRPGTTRATSPATPSPPRPSAETERFIEQVAAYCSEHGVDVIVPTWEEAFYLACRRASGGVGRRALYTPPFEALARLHDKHSFEQLVEQLGIRAPVGVTVRSDEELREAIGRWPHYFGRGVFSRGGVTLLTNTGPLAGRVQRRGRPPDTRRSPGSCRSSSTARWCARTPRCTTGA